MAGQRLLILIVLTLTGLHGANAEPMAPPPLNSEEVAPEVKKPKRDFDEKKKRDSDGKERPGPDGREKRTGDEKSNRPDRKRGGDDGDEVPKKFRERFKNLSSEGQERFRQNWSRWRGMDPKEREKLMDRGLQERKRCEEVIDAALRESDLELTSDEREVFTLRYRQERRKVEEGLRDEVAKMREERLEEMLERLKQEFADKVE